MALAAAMQRLIDDPDLRARLGAAASERVQRFSASRVVPQFEELYRDVLEIEGPLEARDARSAGGPP